MSTIETFITGIRTKSTEDIADADLASVIKELAADVAHVKPDDVRVTFGEHSVVEIAVPVVLATDADRIGLEIAGTLDQVIANRIEWTEFRMRRVRP